MFKYPFVQVEIYSPQLGYMCQCLNLNPFAGPIDPFSFLFKDMIYFLFLNVTPFLSFLKKEINFLYWVCITLFLRMGLKVLLGWYTFLLVTNIELPNNTSICTFPLPQAKFCTAQEMHIDSKVFKGSLNCIYKYTLLLPYSDSTIPMLPHTMYHVTKYHISYHTS